MLKEETTFSFGKNWQFFLKHLNEDRVKNAEISLTDFMDLNSLQNKNFLDIGCGSGLFSYAAYRLGAKSIVSFDADPFSVACCRYLKQKATMPAHWQIFEGSILDKDFIFTYRDYEKEYIKFGPANERVTIQKYRDKVEALIKKLEEENEILQKIRQFLNHYRQI